MSKKRIKQYLMLLTVIGLVSVASGSGTFASFNAEVTNAGNTFATGTLLLSDKIPTANACLSQGDADHVAAGGNVNNNCDPIVTGTNLEPGGTVQSGDVTIKNNGTLDASNLLLSAGGGCTPVGQNTISDGNGGFLNTGNICGKVQMSIQEYSDAARTTPSDCVFGAATGNACDALGNATTLQDISAFDTAFSGGTDLTSISPLSGPLPIGLSRWFTVKLYLPDTGAGAENDVQGESASFDLTWHIDQ
jgi:predicted ribosomally synthesized peptide with SipW-like signal peptide